MSKKIRHFSLILARLFVIAISAYGIDAEADESKEPANAVKLVNRILDGLDSSRGICVVVGGDSSLPLELARSSELLVHCRQPDALRAAKLRSLADQAGLGIDRLVVDIGPSERLPYVDRMIDILIAPNVTDENLASYSLPEIVRVLRPEGRALVWELDGKHEFAHR